MHVEHGQGGTFDLGIAKMRLLAAAEQTGGTFALAEFKGGEGAWTVPHVHREAAESFFVLDGRFTFTIAGEITKAVAGDYVLVPPETKHVLGADAGGGTILVLWVPGGLEQMFIELSHLTPEAILDPTIRAEVASRHDSIPV
jgi:quercetin dioxygenase-like cupin family protein